MWIDRRWLIPGIALSVLLNVFLVGIVAGHFYAGRKGPGDRTALVPGAHVRALPLDERKRFLEVMSAQRAAIVSARKAHQAARRSLEAAIAAPTYDREKVTAGFADLRRAGLSLQEQSNAALVEALATLSPASRAALVTRAPSGDEGH